MTPVNSLISKFSNWNLDSVKLSHYHYAFLSLVVLVKVPLLLSQYPSRWSPNMNLSWFQRLLYIGVKNFAEFWHGYTIHYPKDGKIPQKTLFVSYHSRGTLDLVYFTLISQSQFVIYHLLFQIPMFKNLYYHIGGIPSAKPHNDGENEFMDALVKDPRPLMVLPGGVFEMAKKYEDCYKITWKKNPGFARVIVDKIYPAHPDVCVVPFHTKNCEDLFWQTSWLYTFGGECLKDWARRMTSGEVWLAPFFMTMIAPALGFLFIPRPVKLDVYLGEPIYVQPKETIEEYAERVRLASQELVDRVQALPPEPVKWSLLNIPKDVVYVTIGLYQNISVFAFVMTLTWTIIPAGIALHYSHRLGKAAFWPKRKNKKSE
jgi:1-acyl-sn-glycerol-3-phosphate acyltransferase